MKKIQPLVAIPAVLIFLGSCGLFDYERPFDDAYYESNFIEAIGFGNFAPSVSPSTLDDSNPRTGQWDFAYRYDNWDGFDYMTLTDTGTTAAEYGAADGLSASASVFRLEMLNLVQNGDFEWGEGTWAIPGSAGATHASVASGINGASVSMSIAGNSYLVYSLSPIALQFLEGNSYLIDFKWWAAGGLPPSGTTNQIAINGVTDTDPIFSFNDKTGHAQSDFVALASGNMIRFKTSSLWTGQIDDVSVRKVGNQQLRLLLKKTETVPPLEDFLYVFSFWIHEDPSVGAHTSPYRLDRLGIQMLPTEESMMSTKTDPDYFYDADFDGKADASGWQKKSVKVDNGNLQIDDGAVRPVLELVIDLENTLPGRVLIAQPELRAYPDGY